MEKTDIIILARKTPHAYSHHLALAEMAFKPVPLALCGARGMFEHGEVQFPKYLCGGCERALGAIWLNEMWGTDMYPIKYDVSATYTNLTEVKPEGMPWQKIEIVN